MATKGATESVPCAALCETAVSCEPERAGARLSEKAPTSVTSIELKSRSCDVPVPAPPVSLRQQQTNILGKLVRLKVGPTIPAPPLVCMLGL